MNEKKSVVEKFLNKKISGDVLCTACSHPIMEIPSDGNWIHIMRDTTDKCYVREKDDYCGCMVATPPSGIIFSSPTKKHGVADLDSIVDEDEGEELDEGSVVEDELVVQPQKKILSPKQETKQDGLEENEINVIQNYLFKERGLSIDQSLLIIKILERNLMDYVMKESSEKE